MTHQEYFETKNLGFHTEIVGNRGIAGSASIVYNDDGSSKIVIYSDDIEAVSAVFLNGGNCKFEQSIEFSGADAVAEAIKLIKKFRSRWVSKDDDQTLIIGRYGTLGSASLIETETTIRIFIHSDPLESIKKTEYVRSVTIDRYNWNILDVINAIEEAIQDGLI